MTPSYLTLQTASNGKATNELERSQAERPWPNSRYHVEISWDRLRKIKVVIENSHTPIRDRNMEHPKHEVLLTRPPSKARFTYIAYSCYTACPVHSKYQQLNIQHH